MPHFRAAHLRRAGTSVVVHLPETGLPSIVHWGADLGDLTADDLDGIVRSSIPQRVSGGLDVPAVPSLLPLPSKGWQFEPGVEGSRLDGSAFTPRFEVTGLEIESWSLEVLASDPEAGLSVVVALELGAGGLLSQTLSLTNEGDGDYSVQRLQATFPLPSTARELLTATGRHLKERSPQREAFTVGEHVRTSRRGRPGADATLLLHAGRPGFGFRSGLVHGVHVAWSGDQRIAAVRTPSGEQVIQAGEHLAAGEIVLAPGETYTAPRVVGTWGEGLDESAARFHRELRARQNHPSSPRPVTVNTWEAVYFEHDLDQLVALADAAAEVGAERFVLDDGWFRGRRDDTTALGDWYVDTTRWPDGLGPLIEHVTGTGMEFGLWVEPEMVSLDSDLARLHPEWILHPGSRWPTSGRQQQVLNLADDGAFAYLLERLDSLLGENDISYLKWDHNRDLIEAADPATGRSAVHATTLALYRLIDELRRRHPKVEIETCASGGARVDLGILDRTERVWVSDCIDPLERLDNQAMTSLLVPYELMGCHIGAERSHSTQRVAGLDFQAITALFGHLGVEADLTASSPADLARISAWIATYKRLRPLFHTGSSVHADTWDPSVDVRGVVADDGSHGVFAVTLRAASVTNPVGRLSLPGLDPSVVYEVGLVEPQLAVDGPGQSPVSWLGGAERLRVPGSALAGPGVQMPVLYPGSAVLIEISAVESPVGISVSTQTGDGRFSGDQ